MNELMQSTPGLEALDSDRLLGWDTVFAIRYDHVNSAIAASGRVPAVFEQTVQDEGETLSMSGTFSTWALTVGGSGHAIMMSLRVPSVTLTRTGHSDQTRTDVEYIVRVSLVPVAAGKGPDGGQLVNFTIAGPKSGANREIAVEEIIYEGSESDTTVRFALRGLMEEWLNEHVETFDFVFSTVNLNSRADQDHWQWLRPTATSYAVIDDRETLSSGIFAVLCMTEGRPVARDQEITMDTIPAGGNAAFLISKERFLSRIFRKGVGDMLDGPVTPDASRVWPDDYFTLTDNETMLTNTDDLKIDRLVLKDGEDPVQAIVPARTFQTRLFDTYLEVYFEDLRHSYSKSVIGYLLDVSHEIRTRNVAMLVDGHFGLSPGTKKVDPEFKIATHKITAVKTKAGKAIDVILFVSSAVLLMLPAAGWVWGRFAASAAEEIEGGAAAAAEVAATAVPVAEEIVVADAAGAAVAEAVIAGETATLGQRLAAMITMRRAAIMGAMSFVGWTAQNLLPILVDKDIQSKLPKFDEFAAEVMKPVSWPNSSGFIVTDIGFDNGFVAQGDTQFDETLA